MSKNVILVLYIKKKGRIGIMKQLSEIAQRVEELREISGYSVEYVADKTGVSVNEYKELTSGNTDFSFTFIYKCAQCFGVDVTDIIKGESPTLTSYTVSRQGEGLPLVRRKGFIYNNLAYLFKNRAAEPFRVRAPYIPDEQDEPIKLSTHTGQEFDLILKGSLKVQIGDHTEILNPGDTIYYDSATPHGMIAIGGEPCEFIAVVMAPQGEDGSYMQDVMGEQNADSALQAPQVSRVYEKFIKPVEDENGILKSISFVNEDKYNFAFDTVDELAKKCPDKIALIYVDNDKNERRFTFREISEYSSKTAHYFESLGIKKGDKVMLVLKRHYQFWFSILALHKIGAVVIPATNQLVKHDFEYRFKAGDISAIVCTSDGDVGHQVDLAIEENGLNITRIMVGRVLSEKWHDFNADIEKFPSVYLRTEDSACGDDDMLMFFTSGTTGYPKIAAHSYKYALGHFITAKYWHKVNPDGIHFTISDTGWGKALWGKLYGQWLCETAIFVYDFERFHAEDILPMFAKYNITTFCAPPTMYRFFIKEDLSKYDLSSLEYATTAGEALNPEVFYQFYKATGLKPIEGFGQTETTLVVGNLVGTNPKPGSMGKPTPLYDVRIVLPDGTPAASGETGEIVINTQNRIPCGLFKGYYKDKKLTDEAWHDGFYHTGDTAWCDEDGYLWYVGRTDDIIKSSGYRIGPFEIESVIMELPYVLECAVTAAPDPLRGQIVKANIVLTKGTVATDELVKEIQNYVKENTAPYKYPRIVEFFDELPKTISGKIRRVELRENK